MTPAGERQKRRVAVDKAIWTSINYVEFLTKMQLAGYEVRQGKHLSFRARNRKNLHLYEISWEAIIPDENVRIRLAKNRNKIKSKASVQEARRNPSSISPLMLRPAIEKDLNDGQTK